MIIPKEVQCRTCSQVFCCAKCRQKHEDVNHQEDAMLRKICYICNDRPFPLRKDTKITPNNLLIAHVLKEHLPLQCNRCQKIFHSVHDFEDISKCFIFCPNEAGKLEGECHLETSKPLYSIDDENKENKENLDEPVAVVIAPRGRRKSSLQSGEFQPLVEANDKIDEVDEALLTPLTKINLRWKRKSRQSFDSILSVTNNSSEVANASEVQRVEATTAGVPRKLVRSTSTPMYQWQLMPAGAKQPNESYSATMGQMSSIHCSSGSEADSRTEDLPGSPAVANELDKVRAIIRNRSKAVATPLRQVMSKSIQRAIAQHAGTYSKMLQPGTQRKMSFSSTMSSGMNSMMTSPGSKPMDLRTTPVLKRLGSAPSGATSRAQRMVRTGDPGRETLQLARSISLDAEDSRSQPSQQSTIPSEYYETHRDVESLQANESVVRENPDQQLWKAVPNFPDTPKSVGTLKKVMSFQGLQQNHESNEHTSDIDADEDDVWGTPCGGIPARSFSCSAARGLGDTFKAYDASVEETENDSVSDEVFYPGKRSVENRRGFAGRDNDIPYQRAGEGKLSKATSTGGSRLWSIVSNVIRLASRGDVQEELSPSNSRPATTATSTANVGLIGRAASFADYLKTRYVRNDQRIPRTSSSGSDEYRVAYGQKRRRAATTYPQTCAPTAMSFPMARSKIQHGSPVAKRKRILSRQPIQRLRHTSSDSNGSGTGSTGAPS